MSDGSLIMIAFIFGVFVGIVFMIVIHLCSEKPLNAGDFVITYDDPTKDLIRIDLGQDLPEIEAAKHISFNVVINKNDKDDQVLTNEEGSSV